MRTAAVIAGPRGRGGLPLHRHRITTLFCAGEKQAGRFLTHYILQKVPAGGRNSGALSERSDVCSVREDCLCLRSRMLRMCFPWAALLW